MRFARFLVVTAAAAFWTTAPLVADQHGHAPVPHPTHAHVTPTTRTGATVPSTRTGGTPTGATTPSTRTGGAPTGATTPPTRTGDTHHDGDHHSSTHHDGDHHSGTHTPPPSPVATKIQSHPQLAAKVTAMLPPGMTMNQAARGFKNQGQFIAALHASQRTGIPFSDLRRAMVTHHESLGQAIHSLRPSASGSRVAEHAGHDADHDLGGSHSGTRGTTTGGTTGGTTTGGTTAGTTSGGTTAGTTAGTTTTTTTTSTSSRKHGQ